MSAESGATSAVAVGAAAGAVIARASRPGGGPGPV